MGAFTVKYSCYSKFVKLMKKMENTVEKMRNVVGKHRQMEWESNGDEKSTASWLEDLIHDAFYVAGCRPP